MNSIEKSCALFLCLGLGSAAAAEAAEPGWYLVGFGGEASASGASENEANARFGELFELNGLEVVDSATTVDDSDTGFGVGGGFQYNDHFALEFAYVDLGSTRYDFAGTVTDGTDQADAELQLESSVDGPVFSALGILPVGERFSVFGRVGIAFLNAKGSARVTIDGASQRASQDSQKADPMFGVGAEYALGKHFALRLSWDRYLDIGTSNTTGDIDSDLIALGIRMNTTWFR